MSEDPTTSAGQAPAATPAPTPAPAATNTSPDTPAVDGNNEPFSIEEARKLRKENQALRARQKQIDDAEEAKRLAALSDVEKANKQVQDLQQKYEAAQKQIVASHIQLVAQKTGVRNSELIAGAIGHLLEFDKETGLPTNLEKVLGDLKKTDGYLFVDEQPASPTRQAPHISPNNPGRSAIQPPGQALLPRSQWPKLSDQLK